MSNYTLVSMILGNICGMIGYSIIAPILPIELKSIGFETELLGYMFAAVSIPGIFGSLIGGDILSKYGRRIVLVLSLTALGLSTIMFSGINFISSSSTIVYVICGIRAIEGFSSGFIYCAVRSIIFITYREEKVKYLAYVEAFESATMIFAPAVGSIMYELLGFEMVFVILGAFDLMVASAIMFVVSKDVDINDKELEESNEGNIISKNYDQTNPFKQHHDRINEEITQERSIETLQGRSSPTISVSYLNLLENPLFLIISLAGFISWFEYGYFVPILALRLEEMGLDEPEIGFFFGIYGISYSISILSVSYFTERFEIKGIIGKSMLIGGIAHFLVGPSYFLPNELIIMGVGQLLNGALEVFFTTTGIPAMIEVGEKMYPHNRLEVADKASGIATGMFNIGGAGGAIYGGYISSLIGFRNTADSIAILLISYSFIYYIILKCYSPKTEDSSDIDGSSKTKIKNSNDNFSDF